MKTIKHLLMLVIASIVLLAFLPTNIVAVENPSVDATSQYEIVPCLLPSRIRKLGNMVYPERRRLIETSALECGLKGGEFTYYDRSAPENSVAFFLPLAEQGDTDAQVSLGDVYQFLFKNPQYSEAAQWYQRAADENNKTALMRLALLYEKGRGVKQDGLLATNLWRKATGAGEELVLASELASALTDADQRIAQLTRRLKDKNEETANIRRQLERDRSAMEQRRTALAAAEKQVRNDEQKLAQLASSSVDSQELTSLRKQVGLQKREIDDQRYDIENLQGDLGVREAQLSANIRQVESQNRRLEKELASVSSKADEELEKALNELDSRDSELSGIRKELVLARTTLEGSDQQYTDLLTELEKTSANADSNKRAARSLKKLKDKQTKQLAQIGLQRQQIANLELNRDQAQKRSNKLRQDLDQQVHQTQEVEARFAQTEAKLNKNLGLMGALSRDLDEANKSVLSLKDERTTISQQLTQSKSSTAETAKLTASLRETESRLAARESTIQNLLAEVENFKTNLLNIKTDQTNLFAMRSPNVPDRLPDTSRIKLPRKLKIGQYYALVIGNNNYEYLTDLQNARNDARAMHELLQKDYNFKSKLMLDVTRKELYEAATKLGKELQPEDLVLFYYAGHGYESDNESFWLPVETGNDRTSFQSQGVSSSTVSKWIKLMPANHVLIIADSCYSGSGIEPTGGFKVRVDDLEKQLPYFISSRSRTMLTSGGLAPVMDGDGEGGEHSVFTAELLRLLEENKGVLPGESMLSYLVERIKYNHAGIQVNQTPQFGMIQNAGHETGQFVFLHKNMQF